jgi:hypothetical protein
MNVSAVVQVYMQTPSIHVHIFYHRGDKINFIAPKINLHITISNGGSPCIKSKGFDCCKSLNDTVR